MTVHNLASVRRKAPFPAMPEHLWQALAELGIGRPGPIIAYEIWGRGGRCAVMMTDGHCHINACVSRSHPGAFASTAHARQWATAFFAGLGYPDLPELRRKRRRPEALPEDSSQSTLTSDGEGSNGREATGGRPNTDSPTPSEKKP